MDEWPVLVTTGTGTDAGIHVYSTNTFMAWPYAPLPDVSRPTPAPRVRDEFLLERPGERLIRLEES